MADTTKIITLITGANSGIGLELSALLLAEPQNHVLLCSRSIEKGEAAIQDILSRNLPGTVELLQLDVTSGESINTAAKLVEKRHGRIDALVNNAGIGGSSLPLSTAFPQTYLTNAIGPYLVAEAFIPLLKNSTTTPRILNVSSEGGSTGGRLDPKAPLHDRGMRALPYCTSKAALNFITATQAVVYGEMGMKVFAYSPGWVESNLGPNNRVANGAQRTEDGARPMVGILRGERDGEHGGSLVRDGQYPW